VLFEKSKPLNHENIIEARGLVRRFGNVLAVDRVSFDVLCGDVFGFLGPNGAGKTTIVRMLTGVIEPTEGRAVVDGHDTVLEGSAGRRRMGIVPEQANIYEDLSVWQNLMLMAELYGVPRRRRRERGGELLDVFGLWDRRKQKGHALSKGLRQRVMLCTALVSDPKVLFLDEPTSGLDVPSARLIREIIRQENREKGTTVFLTTHNLKEAEELCSRVAIIDQGRIAALDTPAALRDSVDAARSVDVAFAQDGLDENVLRGIETVEDVVPAEGGFRLATPAPGFVAQEIACLAREKSLRIRSLATREPSLEEVFLHITGAEGAKEKETDG
jgi:ABC-2 type transport system ATP-binding protein